MRRRRHRPTELRTCPKCGSTEVLRWLYGELGGEVPHGYIPGGCIVGPHALHWHCEACGHDWGRSRDAGGDAE